MINTQLSANDSYYHHLRMPLLSLARGTPKRIFEVGCAAGQSLAYFKTRGAEYVVGIELVPEVAVLAKKRKEIDVVLVGNIEQIEIDYPDESFDLIIAGHVLEHVTDPWSVLRRLIRLLKPNGQLIGSLPNIRHTTVVLPLLFAGKWEYQDEGILDWTHFRFFTKNTVKELLESTGFHVDSITPEIFGRKMLLINTMTFGIFKNLLGLTNNFSATKP